MGMLRANRAVPFVAPSFVRRPCLDRALETVLNWRVTFVCAPKGFGKTMGFAAHARRVQAADDDVSFVWLTLNAASHQEAKDVAKDLFENVLDLCDKPESFANMPDAKVSFDEVANMLHECVFPEKQLVICVDNFECVDDGPCGAALVDFGCKLPDGAHLAVLSAREPRFESLGMIPFFQCGLVEASDLAFSADEAVGLFACLNVDVAPGRVCSLVEECEGWPYRVFLEAFALQRGYGPNMLERGKNDLMNALFESLDAHARSFLMQTCLLDALNVDLCSFVLERDDVDADIEELRRYGLVKEADCFWWRVYAPLRLHLIDRLRAGFSSATRRRSRRAYIWYARHGDPYSATKQLLLSGNLDDPLSITRSLLPDSFRLESDIEQKIARMDAHDLSNSPNTCIVAALVNLFAGNGDDAFFWIERLRNACELLDQGAKRSAFEAAIAPLAQKAYVFCGEAEKSMTIGVSLLEGEGLLGTTAQALVHQTLGEAYEQTGQLKCALEHFELAVMLASLEDAPTLLAYAQYETFWHLFRAGRTREAKRLCEEALVLCSEELPVYAGLRFFLLMASVDLGEPCETDEVLERRLEAVSPLRNPDIFLDAHVACARACVLRGEPAEGFRLLMKALGELRGLNIPRGVVAATYAERAMFGLSLENPVDALSARQKLAECVRDGDSVGRAYLELTDMRIALSRCDFASVGLHASALEVLCENGEMDRFRLNARIVRACACELDGHIEQAASLLVEALRLSAESHVVYPFVVYGESLHARLFSLMASRTLDYRALAQARRVLRAIYVSTARAAGTHRFDEAVLLSAREQEILYLLCLGHSREEIANALTLSVNTVKTHLSRMYARIGVSSKTQAVLWAKEHGITPDAE